MGDKFSCYTDDHDVLTERGWVRVDQVRCTDRALTYDPERKTASYEEVLATHAYEVHNEPLYELENDAVSLRTTLNHNMFVCGNIQESEYGLVPARDVAGQPVKHMVACERGLEAKSCALPPIPAAYRTRGVLEDVLFILGASFAGGRLVKAHHRSVFAIANENCAEMHIAIRARFPALICTRAKRAGFHSRVRGDCVCVGGAAWLVDMVSRVLRRAKRRCCDGDDTDIDETHRSLPAWSFRLHPRFARALLRGMLAAFGVPRSWLTSGATLQEGAAKIEEQGVSGSNDAGARDPRWELCTASLQLGDDVQRLAVHAGWSACISAARHGGDGSRKVDAVHVVRVAPLSREVPVNTDRAMCRRVRPERIRSYTGGVYCVTVRTGIVYVRRHGRPVWCGNSRHGQKGVLSQLWPQENMPFTESGMSPDVIINPHAFPSRMTIGMLVESMAGKAGSMHAQWQDATPFQFSEKERAVDFFGDQLLKCGYGYYGSEPCYSGITGESFQVDIYIGIVYYQRLRHMVSDKYQVRSTGPVNSIHRQPIKGRKVGGGIRFGEMERDSLIAHGVSMMANDRLMRSSDMGVFWVCRSCGSLTSVHALPKSYNQDAPQRIDGKELRVTDKRKKVVCRICLDSSGCEAVHLPYVFKYLVSELGGMNIATRLNVAK